MDKVSKDVFNSIEFQSKPWYQGCSQEIVIPSDDKGKHDFKVLQDMENSGKWYAEAKLDGNWNITFRGNQVNHFSRSCMQKDLPIDFADCLPEGTAVVGEVLRGSQFGVVMQKHYGYEFLVIWDILFKDYEPVMNFSGKNRRYFMRDLISRMPTEAQKRFKIIPSFEKDFVNEYLNQHEGLVLKPLAEGPYIGEGKKVDHWIKCKKWYESDAVIIGYEKSTAVTKVGQDLPATIVIGLYSHVTDKQYANAWKMMGSLKNYVGVDQSTCRLVDRALSIDGKLYRFIPVARPTCGDQTLGREIVDNFKNHLYQVMKVRHFGQFDSGSFRHPSPHGGIYALRDDKNVEDCIFTGVTYKVF